MCLYAHHLTKNHLLFAHEIVRLILSKLYSSILSHHNLPLAFTEVIFLPLTKDKKKSLADINNYRPIVIVSILGKVFESCVSIILSNYLDTPCNQLGFVRHGGCHKAILALKTVVNHF